MVKFLILLIISTLILIGCHGCSFIKEKILKKQDTAPQIQREEQKQPDKQQEKQVEPIPVNPLHS